MKDNLVFHDQAKKEIEEEKEDRIKCFFKSLLKEKERLILKIDCIDKEIEEVLRLNGLDETVLQIAGMYDYKDGCKRP